MSALYHFDKSENIFDNVSLAIMQTAMGSLESGFGQVDISDGAGVKDLSVRRLHHVRPDTVIELSEPLEDIPAVGQVRVITEPLYFLCADGETECCLVGEFEVCGIRDCIATGSAYDAEPHPFQLHFDGYGTRVEQVESLIHRLKAVIGGARSYWVGLRNMAPNPHGNDIFWVNGFQVQEKSRTISKK